MLKLAVLLLSVVALNAMTGSNTLEELQPLWGVWKQTHNKLYSHPTEESARQAIFAENYKKIHNFNKENDDIKLALNKFGDLTAGEFKALHTGYVRQQARSVAQDQPTHLRGFLASSDKIEWELLGLPSSVDWREKGAITDVKNQGQCGSCWSFSTTGALEALYFINHGKLLTFSEQQLVDCDRASQDAGCNGGLPEDAFEYTAKKGLETEQDYPYSAADGTCKYDASKAIKVNSGHKAVTPQSASALKAALTVQPVSIGIEADEQVFQFYSSGVITKKCGDNLDHAVLAVGYTTVGSEEAFIVKNSWGPEWGNKGYVYISTNADANSGNGVCGILGDPVVPTA